MPPVFLVLHHDRGTAGVALHTLQAYSINSSTRSGRSSLTYSYGSSSLLPATAVSCVRLGELLCAGRAVCSSGVLGNGFARGDDAEPVRFRFCPQKVVLFRRTETKS